MSHTLSTRMRWARTTAFTLRIRSHTSVASTSVVSADRTLGTWPKSWKSDTLSIASGKKFRQSAVGHCSTRIRQKSESDVKSATGSFQTPFPPSSTLTTADTVSPMSYPTRWRSKSTIISASTAKKRFITNWALSITSFNTRSMKRSAPSVTKASQTTRLILRIRLCTGRRNVQTVNVSLAPSPRRVDWWVWACSWSPGVNTIFLVPDGKTPTRALSSLRVWRSVQTVWVRRLWTRF